MIINLKKFKLDVTEHPPDHSWPPFFRGKDRRKERKVKAGERRIGFFFMFVSNQLKSPFYARADNNIDWTTITTLPRRQIELAI